jgi:hypothetical protein
MNLSTLSAETRNELESLSKFVFGSISHYATLLRKGVRQAVAEEVTEYVPAELDVDGKEVKAEETRQVQVPVKYVSPKRGQTTLPLLKLVRHTPETIKEYMLVLKKQKEEFIAMVEKLQADQKAVQAQIELAKQVQDSLAGSAI